MENTFLLNWAESKEAKISNYKLEHESAHFYYDDVEVWISLDRVFIKVECKNDSCSFNRSWKVFDVPQEQIKEEIDLFLKNCSSKLR